MAKVDKTTTKKLKETKGKNISNYSSYFSARLTSIIVVILLLASVGYLYAKNQELGKSQQKQTIQPVQESINSTVDTISSTPIPTERKIEPTKTPERVPVMVLGSVKNCLASYVDVVKDASKKYSEWLEIQSKSGGLGCLSNASNNLNSCRNNCSTLQQQLKSSVGDLNECLTRCDENYRDSTLNISCRNNCSSLQQSTYDEYNKCQARCDEDYQVNMRLCKSSKLGEKELEYYKGIVDQYCN